MQPPAPFADVLRQHRFARGLTQEELAERAGLSARAVSDLERGVKRMPQLPTVRALAQALALSPADTAAFARAARPAGRGRPPTDQPEQRPPTRPRHNLPLALTSFVGREQQVAELRQHLLPGPPWEPGSAGRPARLLTLVGAGGCGKTRLAHEVATGLVARYADGIWLVELAPLADPALVPQHVAMVLGVAEEPERALRATLADELRARQLLLLLDNCEHLVDACAELAEALLRACPELRILATSREPLGTAGEVVWRVPSLVLPEVGRPLPLAELARCEAVRLFVDRAAAARPGFALTEGNAAPVAHLCRRLDGMPLAIELAAARVRALTVDQILRRMEDHFRLLSGGNRTALPRHQTLRAAIDWSYDLLAADEQRLFERLSVFAGGWTLEAAEAVGSGDGVAAEEVLDLLVRLVDKSLVVVEDQRDGGERYRLLELLRAYGSERLVAAGSADAVRQRHAVFYLELAGQAAAELRGPRQAAWLARFDREWDNLRAALAWYTRTGQAEPGLRLALTLQRLWLTRGYGHEARERLAELLALPAAEDLPALSAWARSNLGVLTLKHGHWAIAQAQATDAVAVARRIGDRSVTARALLLLGTAALFGNQLADAGAPLEESLALFQELGDQHFAADALQQLGMLRFAQGNLPAARCILEASLAISRALGDQREVAITLGELGLVAVHQGDSGTARGHFEESLGILRALDDRWIISLVLVAVAVEAAALGQPERALRLVSTATALAHANRTPLPPLFEALAQQTAAPARAALGDEAGDRLWAEGQAMPLDAAFALALAGAPAV